MPNSIKIFIWRAYDDIFPTRWNLFKRGVPCHQWCLKCSSCEQFSLHAWWSCEVVPEVWMDSVFGVHYSAFRGNSFAHPMLFLYPVLDNEHLEILCHFLWTCISHKS